ncbi:unnamed protein product [Gongylonema pulchrum]|uniref:Sec16_C domain-containing protein n=1 Tax=Gongylonema pulchrum TaxID=637853 RepID=A0A183ESM3_9BILA|nr:unnamed protein product [Gongylonema pulchrum]
MCRDRDGDCAALLPVFCLYQGFVEDENLKRSALGLISELSSHPELAALYAADSALITTFQHYSRSRNQAFATYAEQAYERSMQGGNPSLLYQNCPGMVPATAHRVPVNPLLNHSAPLPAGGGGGAGHPSNTSPFNGYHPGQQQQHQYPHMYGPNTPFNGMTPHPGTAAAAPVTPQYPPAHHQQTPMSTPAPQISSYPSMEINTHIQSQVG